MANFNPENPLENPTEISREAAEGVSPTDEQIIGVLRSGLDDPEAKYLYNIWFSKQEGEADLIGTNLARMEFAVARAIVYYRAGYVTKAISDLSGTLDGVVNIYANERGKDADELEKRIRGLLEKMKGQITSDISDATDNVALNAVITRNHGFDVGDTHYTLHDLLGLMTRVNNGESPEILPAEYGFRDKAVEILEERKKRGL